MRPLLRLRGLANALSSQRFHLFQTLMRRVFRRAHAVAQVDDFDGNLTLDLDLAEHMQRRIFWMGYYNLRLVALLNRLLAPGMVVVDVGANIGEVSLVCANRVGVSGRVIAFEPVKAIADELERNIQVNALQGVVDLRRQGLADVAGEFDIYDSCGQHDGDESNRGLGSLHGDPGSHQVLGRIQVETLDRLAATLALQRLDFMKVDVEGGELACLAGALQTVARFLPVIAVEVHERSAQMAGYRGRDILDLLAPLGYQFLRLEARGRLVPISADALGEYQDVICVADPATRAALTGA